MGFLAEARFSWAYWPKPFTFFRCELGDEREESLVLGLVLGVPAFGVTYYLLAAPLRVHKPTTLEPQKMFFF